MKYRVPYPFIALLLPLSYSRRVRLGVCLGGVRLGVRDGIEAAALQVMHGVEHRGVDVVAQLPVVGLLHLLRV